MRALRLSIVVLVCALTWAAEVPRREYHARRDAARKALDDSVLVLFGRTAAEMEDAGGLAQNPNFYYLTGWTEPGAILMLAHNREVLFLPAHNTALETYTGRRSAATDSDARKLTGFDEVLPIAQFESQLERELSAQSKLLTDPLSPHAAKLKLLAPLRDPLNAETVIAPLRAKKSAAELELIQHATDVSVEAHHAAWARTAPGLFEFQIAATMTFTMLEHGCEGNAYEPIVGSGINGTVLHYSKNSRRIDNGELVLMDVGARCGGYATDITRTIPAGGKFSARQRELYDIVLGSYNAALAAVKPGATMAQLTKIARDYMDAHGKDAAGAPLGKYLKHRISHGVGLEVHDYPTASYSEPLTAGMVITIEPGLYLPDESIGIRIEDTVLVTENGARVLSGALPKEAAEIEKAMAK